MSWHYFLVGVVLGGILGAWPTSRAPKRPPAKVADEILGAAVRGLLVEHESDGKHVRLRCLSNSERSRNLHRIANGLQPRGAFLNPVEYAEASPSAKAAHDENVWNQPIAQTPFDRLVADVAPGAGLQFDLRLDDERVSVRSATEAHAEIAAFLAGTTRRRPGARILLGASAL